MSPAPTGEPKETTMPIKREHHFQIWYAFLALLALFFFEDYLSAVGTSTQTIPYSQFQDMLAQGKLDNLTIDADRIRGDFKTQQAGKPAHFDTVRVDPALAQSLRHTEVTFAAAPPPGWLLRALAWLAPIAIFWVAWVFLTQRMSSGLGNMGGLMSIGRSRARSYVETEIKTTFADVAGQDEAKAELQEIVEFLKAPQRYGRLGAHVPKGVLLVGPPGTGKTLIARAMAGASGVPFFSISGSEFVEMIVGVGAARVRDMFAQAREKAPAIIFIDEIDALGGARSGPQVGGGHDEKEQTLNQLLSEMDGFDPSTGLVILAATNRPEVLDPALLRAGRFDRQVLVDRPDRKGRTEVLRIHLAHVMLAPAVDPEQIAAITSGFTGADLANLVNEAALLATRRNADDISFRDFEEALERMVAGLEKRNKLLGKHEREIVAHHEMGHAIVSMALPDTDPVHKISIIPRGVAALGYTLQRPLEEHYLISRTELVHRIAVLLGGRAAEQLVFREISTGAADDLVRATEIARSMVVRFGMNKELGQVAYEPQRQSMLSRPGFQEWQPRAYGDETAVAIDRAVREQIDEGYVLANTVLQANRDLMLRATESLLESETLDGEQLDAIGSSVVRAPTEARIPAPADSLAS
jgi:cell division protease FtsH